MGDGPPGFRRNLRVPPYSGSTLEGKPFQLPGCYRLWRAFPDRFIYISFVTPYRVSYNPKKQASWFGSFRFARRYSGNRFFFSSSRYLDVSVPWVCLPHAMYSRKDTIRLKIVGSPIRKSLDQRLRTAPQSISVLVPSFFGS